MFNTCITDLKEKMVQNAKKLSLYPFKKYYVQFKGKIVDFESLL